MSKTDTFENDFLKLIFNGTAIANIADDAASSPLTNLYVSLHTADPGENANTDPGGGATYGQGRYETTYTSYARVAVARTSGGWTITGSSVSPTSAISFPECTGGTATITHFGIGTASSGTGKLIYKGSISPSVAVATGVTPRLTTSSTITED